jgi:SnoaL-like protein
MMSAVDWERWARRFESSAGPDDFAALFAAAGTFCDPVTPNTTDVRAVAEHTEAMFPDWRQEVTLIRGGERWAFFEWMGEGTYRGPGAESGPGFPVRLEGATVVEVDGSGLVTRWRDYLDTSAAISQVTAGLQAAGADAEVDDLGRDWEAHFADEPQV